MCTFTEHLNDNEKKLCSEFVLPSLAFTNSIDNLSGEVILYQCEGYENKIVRNYDDYTIVFLN